MQFDGGWAVELDEDIEGTLPRVELLDSKMFHLTEESESVQKKDLSVNNRYQEYI